MDREDTETAWATRAERRRDFSEFLLCFPVIGRSLWLFAGAHCHAWQPNAPGCG